MTLSEQQKKHLRRLAHALKPVVLIGNAGLTPAVLEELERALSDHELIKARARVGDRRERDTLLANICEHTGAVLIQRVGHVATLYRPSPSGPQINLPGS